MNEANQNINLCLPLITLKYQLNCRSSLKPNRARFLFSFYIRGPALSACQERGLWSDSFWAPACWWIGRCLAQLALLLSSSTHSVNHSGFLQSTSSKFGTGFYHPSIMKPTPCICTTSTATRTVDFEMGKQHKLGRDINQMWFEKDFVLFPVLLNNENYVGLCSFSMK